MHRTSAAIGIMWILGCASAPTERLELGPMPEREPIVSFAPSGPVIEDGLRGEDASLGSSTLVDTPAAGFETEPAKPTDTILQGSYPPPQGSVPPPQGSVPPPQSGYPPPQAGYPPPQGMPQPQPFYRTRFTLAGGYYSVTDTKHLDDGTILEMTFDKFITPNFATEGEIGYLEADGKDAGVKTDLWGIPFLFNARFSVPLQKIELYGGAGIGSIYYDISKSPGADVSGWVAAADTFFGANLMLKNGFVVGVESKYYWTDSVSSLKSGLDSYSLMLTFGVAR
jgi:Outer membrane protein beta-barrel domain